MISHVFTKALLARTITGSVNGSLVDLQGVAEVGKENMRFRLEVLSASGTSPTLDVTIQESADGSSWTNLVSFSQATGTMVEEREAVVRQRYVRAVATVGGTSPSFDVAVIALGVKIYA